MDNPYVNGNAALYHPDHRPTHSPPPHPHTSYPPTAPPDPYTLPPIQHPGAASGYSHDLFGQSSRPPQPSYAVNASSFILPPAHGHQRYASTTPAGYPPAGPPYAHNPSYYAQPAPSVLSYDQIGSTLPTPTRLPDLRPMPPTGLMQTSTLPAPYHAPEAFTMPDAGGDRHESAPTHVVASHPRRGMLLGAAGRPAAEATDGPVTAKSIAPPAKDADGKFACPSCNKTYLHAKHLKRHLLRHTGERPYSCILCSDTFSRSDILKRHFAKCSVRKGNPTGATHLSNAQSHLKKTDAKPTATTTEPGKAGLPSATEDPSLTKPPSGLGIRGGVGGQSASTPVSRSNSTKRQSSGGVVRDRRSMTGPVPPAYNRGIGSYPFTPDSSGTVSVASSVGSTPFMAKRARHSGQLSQTVTPDQVLSTRRPYPNELQAAMTPHDSVAMARNASASALHGPYLDWQPFPSDGRTSYVDPLTPLSAHGSGSHAQSERKEVPMSFAAVGASPHDYPLDGFFGVPTAERAIGPDWNAHVLPTDAYPGKSERLIAFCMAGETDAVVGTSQTDNQVIRYGLAAANVEHFLDRFSNFHVHWPVVHMPTFNPVEAYDGLVLSMICIGAVYSDRLNTSQVRVLLERVQDAIGYSSKIAHLLEDSPVEPDDMDGIDSAALDELTALMLLQSLSTWHGDPYQRQAARREFGKLSKLARRFGMLDPMRQGSASYSMLHQPSPASEAVTSEDWSWPAWIRQERRSRLMYFVWLYDVANVMFFNCHPGFDAYEIKLPLPADDAAWDAASAQACAAALGLHGAAAQAGNVAGSCRRKQIEMDTALRALMHPTCEFPARSTNAYSKFILVHALHVQIWHGHRQLAQGNALLGLAETGFPGPGFDTAYGHEWSPWGDGSGRTSLSNSGPATPTDSSGAQSPAAGQILRHTAAALHKWKQMWDDDMPLQFPSREKRLGFCRDGIHFYWLARLLLSKPTAAHTYSPPDTRCMQLFSFLKQVRSFVESENASRGDDIGSVGDIDESYGITDLTLDMKLLFTPLTPEYSSTPI